MSERLRRVRVPPLVLQPLVENAVKHGITTKRLGGDVAIVATLHDAGDGQVELSIVVRDTGAGVPDDVRQLGRERGLGLRNVERRLHCQYGPAASLSIRSVAGMGTTAEIRCRVRAYRRAQPDVPHERPLARQPPTTTRALFRGPAARSRM